MNWLTKIPNALFHGTDSLLNINDYETGRDTSNDYGLFGIVKTTRHGIFLTDNMDFAKEYGTRVIRIKSTLQNTANINDNLRYEFISSIDPWNERDLWIAAKYAQHIWQLFDGEVGSRFVN